MMRDVEAVVEEELLSHMAAIKDVLLKTEQKKKIDNSLNIELKEVEERIDALMEQMSVKGLSGAAREALNKSLTKLCREQERIQSEIASSSVTSSESNGQLFHVYDIISNWSSLPIEEKKEIAHLFIRDIHVTDSLIEIDFIHNFA